ncbi:MAG: serine/threonine-protein kinase, partial [Bacteroidales bacterium]|nr:serine/threonine-protein kinase [Bacteroidales bacterium]
MLSDYEYISVKGQGYFCIVKKYRNKVTGQEVAIKELKKEFYEHEDYRYRFAREIELLKSLQGNDNIINLIEEGKTVSGSISVSWYVMPYAEHNLYDYIKRNNTTLTLEQRIDIVEQIISGLEFSHSKNILHRDLSPTNIFIFKADADFVVKIADFGLGKDVDSLSHYTKSSQSGYGQVFYVSPEQYNQLKYATERSDIYSLGKVIYFVITGKDPRSIEICELSSLIEQCINDVPEERFANLSELKIHLESIKKLLFNKEIDFDYITLHDFCNNESDIDWIQFHAIAIKGVYFNHVYSDYINPILSLFTTEAKIIDYYKAINSGINDFINIFIDKL